MIIIPCVGGCKTHVRTYFRTCVSIIFYYDLTFSCWTRNGCKVERSRIPGLSCVSICFPISPVPVTVYDANCGEKIGRSGGSEASSDALKGPVLFGKTKEASGLRWEREAILQLQWPVAER